MIKTAQYWIDHLGLKPHPEGGYYTETYRAKTDGSGALGGRAVSTGIYFLLELGQISHFHRIDADEMWHFYCGDPLNVYCIEQTGQDRTLHLGPEPLIGHQFQAVVPAGSWFGAGVAPGAGAEYGYALVGCTVSPGFDFEGFELAEREVMLKEFPQHDGLIRALTPEP